MRGGSELAAGAVGPPFRSLVRWPLPRRCKNAPVRSDALDLPLVNLAGALYPEFSEQGLQNHSAKKPRALGHNRCR